MLLGLIYKKSQKQKDKFRIEKIGYIFQDFKLIDEMTVMDNIGILRLEKVDISDIDNVLRSLEILEKKNKKVKHLSGGEKQRISIARALLKDAPILILDDSVSAVDVNTEKTILSNLKQMREGKTTILIAHRISTIENMDKIIFIDDGEIIAVGTHNELYKSCEDYKTLVDLQRLDDVKNDASNESEVLLNV